MKTKEKKTPIMRGERVSTREGGDVTYLETLPSGKFVKILTKTGYLSVIPADSVKIPDGRKI